MPSTTSGRSVEASEASAGKTVGGTQVREQAELLTDAEQAASRDAMSTGMSSHFGPPTAPSSTARERRRHRSITSSRSGVPCASIEQPPINSVSNAKSIPNCEPTASSTRRACSVTSGPIPSPGNNTIRSATLTLSLFECRVSVLAAPRAEARRFARARPGSTVPSSRASRAKV